MVHVTWSSRSPEAIRSQFKTIMVLPDFWSKFDEMLEEYALVASDEELASQQNMVSNFLSSHQNSTVDVFCSWEKWCSYMFSGPLEKLADEFEFTE